MRVATLFAALLMMPVIISCSGGNPAATQIATVVPETASGPTFAPTSAPDTTPLPPAAPEPTATSIPLSTPAPTRVPTMTLAPLPIPTPTRTPTPAPLPTPTPIPSVTVAAVVIDPPIATLNIGETQQFSFQAFDEAAKEITGVLASWSVDPEIGTIDSQGLFTAGSKSGDHFMGVKLEVISGTSRATDAAAAFIAADPLATIEINSAPIVLAVDENLQLNARGYDRHGNEIRNLQFVWEATPGLEVDNQGVITKSTGPLNGLVGWWRGEGNARDSAGANHGTIANGIDYVTGVVGTAFHFDGVDQYITIEPSDELNITGDITISMWVNRSVYNTRPVLISKGGAIVDGIDKPTAYVLLFGSPSPIPRTSGDYIWAIFERTDGSNVDLISPAAATATFHHHAYVRRGNTHTLFQDGKIVATETFTGTPADTSGLPLMIGNVLHTANPTRFVFGGTIDEVRIYDKALFDSEILAIFNSENRSSKYEVTAQAKYKNSVRSVTVEVNLAAD